MFCPQDTEQILMTFSTGENLILAYVMSAPVTQQIFKRS